MLRELSADSGMVLNYDQLLLRLWGVGHSGDSGLVWIIVTSPYTSSRAEDGVQDAEEAED